MAESIAACMTGRLSVNDDITRPAWVEVQSPIVYRVVFELRGRPEVARNFPTAPAEDVLSWLDLYVYPHPGYAPPGSTDSSFAVRGHTADYMIVSGGFWHMGVMYDASHCADQVVGR